MGDVKRRRQELTPKMKAKWVEMYEDGHTLREISTRFSYCRKMISDHIKSELGIETLRIPRHDARARQGKKTT